jgi:pyruvate kinase
VKEGGILTDHKGLNKQGGGLSALALTDKDRMDIIAAAELEMDFVSVSFARNADDINEARNLLRAAGGKGHIVAKIERAEAVENISEIIEASDVIMVARGDLAVEIGYAAMTGLQKSLIRQTQTQNKISITATQMLESMITSPSPTRAEASDVANAVMDGTDAVMLSAETAVGKFPAQAVQTMSELCIGAEKHETFRRPRNYRMEDVFTYVDEAIALAAMYTANHLQVSAIIAFTESGATSLWMSRVRSDIPIYAFTRHEATRRRVALYRGVYPASFDVVHVEPGRIYQSAIEVLEKVGAVRSGDLVLFTGGDMAGVAGRTNTLRILEVNSGGRGNSNSDSEERD